MPDYDVEHSELLLYHIALLEEAGEFSEALGLLDVNAKARVIIDRTAIMERRGTVDSKNCYEMLTDIISKPGY